MGSDDSPYVDLTDDSSDGNLIHEDSNHNTRFNGYGDSPRSSAYVASPSNPAKRSRIDTSTLNPAALLNPRAFVGNGSSTARPEIQSFQGRQQMDASGGSGVSLNRRMEALHGLKDRKAKAPTTPKDFKRDVSESQDRQAGNHLLSKTAVNGAGTPVIDLTGTAFQ